MSLRLLSIATAATVLAGCKVGADTGSQLAVADVDVYQPSEVGALPPLPDGKPASTLIPEIKLRRSGYGSTLTTTATTTLQTIGGPRPLGPGDSLQAIAALKDASGQVKWYRAFHPVYGEGYVDPAAAKLNEVPEIAGLGLADLAQPSAPQGASTGNAILSGHGDVGHKATGTGAPLIREVYWLSSAGGAPVSQAGNERYLMMAGATLRHALGMPAQPDFSKLQPQSIRGQSFSSGGGSSQADATTYSTGGSWGSSGDSGTVLSDGSTIIGGTVDSGSIISGDAGSVVSAPVDAPVSDGVVSDGSSLSLADGGTGGQVTADPFLSDPNNTPTLIVYARNKLAKIKGTMKSRGYPFSAYATGVSGGSGTYPDGTVDLDQFAFTVALDGQQPQPCVLPNGQLHAIAFQMFSGQPGTVDTSSVPAWSLDPATAAAAGSATGCFKYEVPFGQLVPADKKSSLKAENWFNAHITIAIKTVPQPSAPPPTVTVHRDSTGAQLALADGANYTVNPKATGTISPLTTVPPTVPNAVPTTPTLNPTISSPGTQVATQPTTPPAATAGVDPDCPVTPTTPTTTSTGTLVSKAGVIGAGKPGTGSGQINGAYPPGTTTAQGNVGLPTTPDTAVTCGTSVHEFNIASPIVLHFAPNEAFTTTSVLASKARFDVLATGHAVPTGWLGAKSGLLALDRNGNGVIDDGSELFGEATLLKNGRRARDGYAALAQYDTQGKGYLDASDPVFAKLVVWFNDAGDGVTKKGELHSLASLGITRIDVKAQRAHVNQGGLFANDVRTTAKFYGPVSCGTAGCNSYDVYFRMATGDLVEK